MAPDRPESPPAPQEARGSARNGRYRPSRRAFRFLGCIRVQARFRCIFAAICYLKQGPARAFAPPLPLRGVTRGRGGPLPADHSQLRPRFLDRERVRLFIARSLLE